MIKYTVDFEDIIVKEILSSIEMRSSVTVSINDTFNLDGVWKPSSEQLQRIQKSLRHLPFTTKIQILISDVFGTRCPLKPENTIIFKQRDVDKRRVAIHEFGHHIYFNLSNIKKKEWEALVDQYGSISGRDDNPYDEEFAYSFESIYSNAHKRLKKPIPEEYKEFIKKLES